MQQWLDDIDAERRIWEHANNKPGILSMDNPSVRYAFYDNIKAEIWSVKRMNNIKMGSIESKHNDYTCNGKCSNCGACCSNTLPMTKQDIARIRRYINKHHIEPINHVPAIMAYKHMDGICPFRDMTNERCVIYEVRPTVCRLYQCNYSIVDIAKAVKEHLFLSKIKSYDVRSTFYGNGELSAASLLTIKEGNKYFNKEFKENKDAFLGVIKYE